jgi:hypothetical protein
LALWCEFAGEAGALLQKPNALEQGFFCVEQMSDAREQGKANTVLGHYQW